MAVLQELEANGSGQLVVVKLTGQTRVKTETLSEGTNLAEMHNSRRPFYKVDIMPLFPA